MFFKNINKPRQFNYRPKFYTPQDEDEKRIRFKQLRKNKHTKKGSTFRLVILVILLALMSYYLNKKAGNTTIKNAGKKPTITVEEVIVVE